MEKITTVGLDIAKSVFSLHGVDAQGRTILRKTVRRDKLMCPKRYSTLRTLPD